MPFIDEMLLLWKGIKMYDISCPPSNKFFMFYGILCWTIHDFPGLGVCSGKKIIFIFAHHNLFSIQLAYNYYIIIILL